jgi:hypothetical protein
VIVWLAALTDHIAASSNVVRTSVLCVFCRRLLLTC